MSTVTDKAYELEKQPKVKNATIKMMHKNDAPSPLIREEKVLCQFAVVASRKLHLKSEFALFQTSSILFTLI